MMLLLNVALAFTHEELGQDRGGAHMLGLNPKVSAQEYRTRGSLQGLLVELLEDAKDRGLLDERTLVVLPDDIGHWLIYANESPAVYRNEQAELAAWRAGLAHPISFMLSWWRSRDAQAALTTVKGDEAVGIWRRICVRLSSHYQVWLAGGSATDGDLNRVRGLWSPTGELQRGRLSTPFGPVTLGDSVSLGEQNMRASLHGNVFDESAGHGSSVATLGDQTLRSSAPLVSVWLAPPSLPGTTAVPRPQLQPESGEEGSSPLR